MGSALEFTLFSEAFRHLSHLNIPQEAATINYEYNDGCTAIGNALKPMNHTCHVDIKYFALCEWIERDLIRLERVDTAINTADHLSKALTQTLFHRHADYLLGNIPRRYSPAYDSIVNFIVKNNVNNQDNNTVQYVPKSLTTPATAKAKRIYKPTHDKIDGNP